MFFITLLDQFYWVASAGLGAVVGSVLPFSTKGVDFVITVIPGAIAIAVTIALHRWKHQTLVSITGGTVCYVLLVQLVFA